MGLLDKSFRYVPASKTDVRKTIAKELRRLAEQKEVEAQQSNVTELDLRRQAVKRQMG